MRHLYEPNRQPAKRHPLPFRGKQVEKEFPPYRKQKYPSGTIYNVTRLQHAAKRHRMRDCPSLVGGRPAKSVVERPRGFKSHIPRQIFFT